jgi:hypothetical protein
LSGKLNLNCESEESHGAGRYQHAVQHLTRRWTVPGRFEATTRSVKVGNYGDGPSQPVRQGRLPDSVDRQ